MPASPAPPVPETAPPETAPPETAVPETATVPPPRRSAQTADFGPGLRAALRVAGYTFAVSLALVLLDVLAGIRLPAAVRPALPWALVAATLAAVTLLVGALGMPRRPDPPGDA